MTAYSKIIGYGSLLQYSTDGGESWATVSPLVDGMDGSATMDVVDTTVFGDAIKTYQPGQMDPGTIDFTCGYNPTDTETTKALNDLFYAGTLANWRIQFNPVTDGSGAATESFQGFIKDKGRTIQKLDLCTTKITIQISGDPGFTQ